MEHVKKKCVVLDTNIWVYNSYLLRSPMGASMLYYLKMGDILLGLPEVVELEIHKHSLKIAKNAIQNIEKFYGEIEILLGERDDYAIPTEEQIEQSIKYRLESLEHFLFRVPFSFNQAKGALNKVLNEVPPNAPKNQQFKDTLIWEAILDLSKDYVVYFVTQDKGFFENKEFNKGLAQELKNEIKAKGVEIHLYNSIESFLNEIKPDIEGVDKENLNEQIKNGLIEELKLNKDFKDVFFRDVKDSEISLFLTESTELLSVSFTLDIDAIGSANDKEFTIRADGECSYNLVKGIISNMSLDTISRYNQDGSKNVNIFVSGNIQVGRGVKKYSLRSPL